MIRFRQARISMGRDRRLSVADWTLNPGECWVISGSGGSGKSTLARCIAGGPVGTGWLPGVAGMDRVGDYPASGGWISFDRETEIRAEIRRNDDSEWSGEPDEGSTLSSFVGSGEGLKLLDPELRERLEGRGIRNLSTGEFRQVLIAREAGSNPHLLVLDEPWEGLDAAARPRLTAMLSELLEKGTLVVLTVNRLDDAPLFTSGLVRLRQDRAEVTTGDDLPGILRSAARSTSRSIPVGKIPGPPVDPPDVGSVLVDMQGVSLSYQERTVLENVNWTIRRGESWLLTGPNGSGKTSLLNLINGDEPRAFGQNISLFGRKKGSGESTAWLLERMGRVSASLQERVSRHAGAAEVVGSGLNDALVLTQDLDGFEQGLVNRWLEILGLSNRGDLPFYRLSYGERRLAMIGRAMIKHPPLLLLDEPMHGLDGESRERVSALVDILIRETGTTVLFVSHRPDDAPPSITRHMELVPDDRGISTGVIRNIQR